VRAGAVDAFASDYVPPSLVEAAFQCARNEGISLPEAVAMISDHPARMSVLSDRGRLETGLRADMVRIRLYGTLPIVRQVWRAGERVI
jgi:alpha-D-ribose 1-methylphosphonate 5-triphosphate diphosphatase